MLSRCLPCFALALALTGCATPGPSAGSEFDGLYQGSSRLVRGGGPLCCTSDENLALVVREGQFDYPFLVSPPRTAPLHVQIATDGNFRGDMQFGVIEPRGDRSDYRTEWATVTGRIIGSSMEGNIENLECTRQISMQRR